MLYKPIKDYVAQYHPHLNLCHRHWGGHVSQRSGLQSRGRRELHRHYPWQCHENGRADEIKRHPLTSQTVDKGTRLASSRA